MPVAELEREFSPEIFYDDLENTVAVISFDGQNTLEIKDAVERLGVRAEVFPHDVDPERVKHHGAFVLSGGSQSVYEKGARKYNPALAALNKKIMVSVMVRTF